MTSLRSAAALRLLLRRWRDLPVVVRDGLAVALGSAIVFQPALGQVGARVGDLPARSLGPAGVLVTAALWLPLVVRRLRPEISLALVGAAFAVHELLGYRSSMATMGLYVALYSAGAHLSRGRWIVALVTSTAYLALTVALLVAGSPNEPAAFAVVYGFLVACWGAGAWVRARQRQEEERRQLSVQAAMAEERARIARELHDVVTHHVTAMVVQADAAQFVLTEDSPALTGLSAISDTGRRALGDLRNLLGVLTTSLEGQDQAQRAPAVGRIADLVEQTRSAGQPVEFVEQGTAPATTGGTQLAAYRVVQEALTNALKHAPGRATQVRITYRPNLTELEVLTAGPADGSAAARPTGRGHGLNGMRARVEVFGGHVVTGPTTNGWFQVLASIPEEGPQ